MIWLLILLALLSEKNTSEHSDKSRIFYHTTTVMDLEDIIKQGLVPEEPYTDEKAVYLWDSVEMARKFGEYKYGDFPFEELFAILEVRIPKGVEVKRREITHPEARKAGFTHEYLVKEVIPPQNLKIVYMEETDTPQFYRFKEKLKSLGFLCDSAK